MAVTTALSTTLHVGKVVAAPAKAAIGFTFYLMYSGASVMLPPLYRTTYGRAILGATTGLSALYIYANITDKDSLGYVSETRETIGQFIGSFGVIAGLSIGFAPLVARGLGRVNKLLYEMPSWMSAKLYNSAIKPLSLWGVEYLVTFVMSYINNPIKIVDVGVGLVAGRRRSSVEAYIEDLEKYRDVYGYNDANDKEYSLKDYKLSSIERFNIGLTTINFEKYLVTPLASVTLIPFLKSFYGRYGTAAEIWIKNQSLFHVKFSTLLSNYSMPLNWIISGLKMAATEASNRGYVRIGGKVLGYLTYSETALAVLSISINVASIIMTEVSVRRVSDGYFTRQNQNFNNIKEKTVRYLQSYERNIEGIKTAFASDLKAEVASFRSNFIKLIDIFKRRSEIDEVLKDFAQFKFEEKMTLEFDLALAIKLIATGKFGHEKIDANDPILLEVLQALVLAAKLPNDDVERNKVLYPGYGKYTTYIGINLDANITLGTEWSEASVKKAPKGDLAPLLSKALPATGPQPLAKDDNMPVTKSELALLNKIPRTVLLGEVPYNINVEKIRTTLSRTTYANKAGGTNPLAMIGKYM